MATTKTERIIELLHTNSKQSERVKTLKLECGQQATKICVLNLRIKELESAATTNSIVANTLNERIKELETVCRNALTSLAIINMPVEGNPANVATDKELMDIMAESFREALGGK